MATISIASSVLACVGPFCQRLAARVKNGLPTFSVFGELEMPENPNNSQPEPIVLYSVCEWDHRLVRLEPVNEVGESIGPIGFIPNRRNQDEPDQVWDLKRVALESQLEAMQRRIRWQTVVLTIQAMSMLVVILIK